MWIFAIVQSGVRHDVLRREEGGIDFVGNFDCRDIRTVCQPSLPKAGYLLAHGGLHESARQRSG